MQIEKIILARRPVGEPTFDNFKLEFFNCPKIKSGEILVKVKWLSLDPYMRGRMDNVRSYASPVEIGEAMEGECIGEIIVSKNHQATLVSLS